MKNADLVITLDLNKRLSKVINGKTAENGLRVDVLREIKTKASDKKKTRKKMKDMRKMEEICLKRKISQQQRKKSRHYQNKRN